MHLLTAITMISFQKILPDVCQRILISHALSTYCDMISGAPVGEDGKHIRPVLHRFVLYPVLCEERSKFIIPLFTGRFRFQFYT